MLEVKRFQQRQSNNERIISHVSEEKWHFEKTKGDIPLPGDIPDTHFNMHIWKRPIRFHKDCAHT